METKKIKTIWKTEKEEQEVKVRNVHHGHNIRLACMLKNIKQGDLAEKISTTQPNVSKHENAPVLDDELLERYAKALDVSVEALKTMEENDNEVNHFNPIEKISELYERLLQEIDDKFAAVDKRLRHLEDLLSKK